MRPIGPLIDPDLLELDLLIGDEERLVRDEVRRFVAQEVLPIIRQHYRAGTFPRQLVPRMGDLGLLGPTLDAHGAVGASHLAYGLIMQELERADSALRSFCSVQSALVIHPIYAFGSEAQQQRWLPPLIRGEAIGCFGLTEPDFGSNPAAMRTRARLDGDSYVLDGCKMWITNGSLADVALIFARCDDGRVGGFLLEKGRPGFTTVDIEGKLSLRASVTSQLVLQDCRIPADNRLPGAVGLGAALACLDQARYGIAFGAVGAALACFEEALGYVKERRQFGNRPIASHQLVQQSLADMYSEIVQAQLLCLQLARLKQQGRLGTPAISLAKRNNVAMALRTARAARDLLGASGIVDDHGAMRHMCNLESVQTYEGTYNIHTLVLGQALTGEAAFG